MINVSHEYRARVQAFYFGKKLKGQATVQSAGIFLQKGKTEDESGNIKGRKEMMKQSPEVTGEG